MSPEIQEIVLDHYDPEASREAKQPMFMVKTYAPHANHTIEFLDSCEFAEWLRKVHRHRLTVDQINQAVRLGTDSASR